MGKLVMSISAAVTGFILALTAGAIYAYRSTPAPAVTITQPPSASAVNTTLDLAPVPMPTSVANVSPQDAASMAAKAINRTDLYSVELADYQGVQAFKVTFSSGDIVYVGMQGQILGTEPPPAPILVTQSGGSGGGGQGKGAGSSHHEDDHEEHDGGDD